jgi:hypothetical protein
VRSALNQSEVLVRNADEELVDQVALARRVCDLDQRTLRVLADDRPKCASGMSLDASKKAHGVELVNLVLHGYLSVEAARSDRRLQMESAGDE